MKFQSLEESGGIFQEYVIGSDFLLEKNFMKLEYYEYSLAFCLWIYRPSNLSKIGVIIYSNIILKLKYHSSYIYDYSPPLVLHLMAFHGFCFYVVFVYRENLGVIAGTQPLSKGPQRWIWLVLGIFAQTVPVTVLLTQPVSVGKWTEEMFRITFLTSIQQSCWAVWFEKLFSW